MDLEILREVEWPSRISLTTTSAYIHFYAHSQVYKRVNVYTYTDAYMHTNIHTYIHTYTHIHNLYITTWSIIYKITLF
jgi:hypothetical protein